MKDYEHIFNEFPPFVFTGHPEDGVKKVSLTQAQLYRDMEKRCSEMERTMQQMSVDQEEVKTCNVSQNFVVLTKYITVHWKLG